MLATIHFQQISNHQHKHVDVSKNTGTPKWMVYNGKPYQNWWFGGTRGTLECHPCRRTTLCWVHSAFRRWVLSIILTTWARESQPLLHHGFVTGFAVFVEGHVTTKGAFRPGVFPLSDVPFSRSESYGWTFIGSPKWRLNPVTRGVGPQVYLNEMSAWMSQEVSHRLGSAGYNL